MKKKMLTLLMTLLLAGWSLNAWSFNCKTVAGASIPIGGGSANVYVNLEPSINVGQNLIIDLSTQISCKNDSVNGFITDFVSLEQGSTYGGALLNFKGTLRHDGNSYPFPLMSSTSTKSYNDTSYSPWPVQLYLTPVSVAQGVVITSGSLIAILKFHQTNDYNGRSDYFIWNIYASNDVVIPTGGCDVSARNVTVTLPDYPGTIAVPVSVYCAQNQNLGYYLSGTTADSASSIFTNTASASPADGIGIQLKRNGSVLSTNSTVSLGMVGTSAVNLGLTATYARTTGQVTAGNVQSIIGVTFVYQ